MPKNEIITLQFGHYSNFIGSHWWNIQEASFIYNAETVPEINYDVLFREGETLRKEVTYTPRLLLVDVKGSLGSSPQCSDLYEDIQIPVVSEDTVLWTEEKVEVEQAPKRVKNEFLEDLERQEKGIEEPTQVNKLVTKYELDEKVDVWTDYLGTRFHPRTINIINDYQHGHPEQLFETYAQGAEIWKTEFFSEEYTDKCRAYAEECDFLQGFQVLFDCVDGFSGLTTSVLEYLQDEYSSKSIFSFPSIASTYGNATNAQNFTRTVNSALSFSELAELSLAFVPLSTGGEGWNDPGPPRSFANIKYKHDLWYHSSALLASYLDTVSISYRKRNDPLRLSSLLSTLSPCGRKLLSATMRLPFPIYPELSVMEAFEKLDDPIWTTITPKTNVTVDSTDLQDITVRGLTKCRLLPNTEQRIAPNPSYKCQNVEEMLSSYLEYCSTKTTKTVTKINSIDMPLKIPVSYPNIFDQNVTRIGYVSPVSFPASFAVVEAPVMAGLHNCSNSASLLSNLHEKAAKINLRHLHQFSAGGLEQLEYNESLEKLLNLRDTYEC